MGLEYKDLVVETSESRPAPKQPAAQPTAGRKPRGKFVCSYAYTDEQGTLLFEACRYQREDGSKTFSLRQPDPSEPSGWRNTKEGVRLVLYRLPEVLSAIKADKPVFIVEGEKDCDNMAALGYAATTNPMGAGKWHNGEYAPSLAGADVVIVPDNDKVGQEHAQSNWSNTLPVSMTTCLMRCPGRQIYAGARCGGATTASLTASKNT